MLALAVVLVLLAACGGDDTASEPPAADQDATTDGSKAGDPGTEPGSGEQPSGEQPSGEQPTDEPETQDPATPAAAGGANIATVTIGGDTYEVDVTPGTISRCDPNFFGAFWALGNGDGASIELLLPPRDDPSFQDPPTVMLTAVDGDHETVWVADPSREMAGVDAGESQVDDFTVSGNSVSGAATFVDLDTSYAFQGGTGDEPVPVTGTFSVTCPD